MLTSLNYLTPARSLILIAALLAGVLCGACGGERKSAAAKLKKGVSAGGGTEHGEQPSPPSDDPAATRAPEAQETPRPRPTDVAPAMNLLSNRYMAHLRSEGGLVIPCNAPGILKYTQGTWKSDWHTMVTVDGAPAALTRAVQGTLRFPFDPAACRDGCELRFVTKALHPGQRLSVFVNKDEYPAMEIGGEFAEYRLRLRQGSLVEGENQIRFHHRRASDYRGIRTAAAFRSIAIVPTSAPRFNAEAGGDFVRDVTIGGERRPSIALKGFDGADWHLTVPEGARLLVATGIEGDEGAFGVTVTRGLTGETRKLADATVRPGAWREHDIDLSALAGEVIRLSLRLKAPEGARAALAEPVVVVPPRKVEPPPRRPKNVVIWLVDTMRWDRLKAYNEASRVKMPNFEELASEGTLYEHFTVQGGHSIPTHASLITGLYPSGHGHNSPDTRLRPNYPLLSELLKKRGLRTALISSNAYVSTRWGFNRGWDHYKNFIRDGEASAAEPLFNEASRWLERNHQHPFFLYLITIDMHVTYRWRDEYCLQYDPEPYNGPVPRNISGHFLNRINQGRVKLNERDRQRIIATYDCTGTYNDEYFGRLMAQLERHGVRDDTLVIVVSDHGEEFFEYGGIGHGQSLHDVLVRVPFILNLPGVIPRGKRVATNAELVDMAPTVLDLMGFGEDAKGMHGQSLVPDIFGEGPEIPRPAFADQRTSARSMAIGRFKYILKHGNNAQLYDLERDPYEKNDIRKKHPIVDRYARDVLSFWVTFDDRWEKPRFGTPAKHSDRFVEEVRHRR